MNDTTYERTCLGPNCGAEFRTTKSQQTYCSYDCYYNATRDRSKAYYQKVREAGGMLQKVCPYCHEQFETKKLRVKYCSNECYHGACLEKNRAYAQNIRDEWKAKHPKNFKRKCELCDAEYDYRTKQGKYCSECSSSGLAKRIASGQGPTTIPTKYQDLPTGEVLASSSNGRVTCFVCGGPSEAKDLPCKSCDAT